MATSEAIFGSYHVYAGQLVKAIQMPNRGMSVCDPHWSCKYSKKEACLILPNWAASFCFHLEIIYPQLGLTSRLDLSDRTVIWMWKTGAQTADVMIASLTLKVRWDGELVQRECGTGKWTHGYMWHQARSIQRGKSIIKCTWTPYWHFKTVSARLAEYMNLSRNMSIIQSFRRSRPKRFCRFSRQEITIRTRYLVVHFIFGLFLCAHNEYISI